MKKLLTLLFVGLSLLGYAQKLQLTNPEGTPYINGQTITAMITTNDLNPFTTAYHVDITVKNLTSDNLTISTLCSGKLAEGMMAEVCFGACYMGDTIAISSEIPGLESALYELHLKPQGNLGLSRFKLEFTTEGETITLHLIVDMCGIGVKERNNATVSLSAFPNPASANSKINVAYTLADMSNSHRLVVRNILGAEVMNIPLNPYENTTSIDASALKPGAYFYAIENKNQISIAKKLIVK